MWLQDQIFEFSSLDDAKLDIKEIVKSNLVIDDKVTDVTLEKLFKGAIKIKSDTRVKGFSILEFVNEKSEIEINKNIYIVSFINNGVAFKLNGYVKSQMQRNDKELSIQEIADFGKLISGSTPTETAQVAATVDSTSSEAKTTDANPDVKAEDGAGVKKLFLPVNYEEDKKELVEDGYTEYKPEVDSNYRFLTKGKKSLLIELYKDDYVVLENIDDFDIELEDKTHKFKIETIKQEQPV